MKPPRDPLTSASVTTAWVIVFNKPFYPLYVWWVAGSGVRASLLTLIAMPLFAALPYSSRAARAGLPLVGVADTAFSTLMFGESSGVEAFFVPCAALAMVSFSGAEAWTGRALTVLVFVAFAVMRYFAPAGVFPWPASEIMGIVNLNLYSAASLTAFVGLRFAAARP